MQKKFNVKVALLVFLLGLLFVWIAKGDNFCSKYIPELWQEGTSISQRLSIWPPGTRCAIEMPAYLAPKGLSVSIVAPVTAVDLAVVILISLAAGKVVRRSKTRA